MSGWIRAEKELTETIRFKRMVKAYRNALRSVTERDVTRDETLLLGALIRMWMYADSHIRDDNTLVITCDEIDELVGVEGFAKSLPVEWLKVIDAERVELPDFLEHNGTSARQRKNNAKRQANFRSKRKQLGVTRDVTHGNARNDARPDQTRPEETRPESEDSARDVSRGTRDAGNALGGMVDDSLTEFRDTWKRDVEGVNIAELDRFFTFAAHQVNPPSKRKDYSATARISLAKKLSGMGDLEIQRKVIEQSMAADHVVLYPLKDKPSKFADEAARKKQSDDAAWADLGQRADRIACRWPMPGEDLGSYRAIVERAERDAKDAEYRRGLEKRGPQPIAKLLGGSQ